MSGGKGGAGVYGGSAAGGSSGGAGVGGTGATGERSGGGGGGGSGTSGGAGGDGGRTAGGFTPGAGGAGGTGPGGDGAAGGSIKADYGGTGGGGGGGAAGAVLQASGAFDKGFITGGAGGNGGDAGFDSAGGGGEGAAGLVVVGTGIECTVDQASGFVGGTGGAGGKVRGQDIAGSAGSGGDGGLAIYAGDGNTIVNNGTLAGGAGGSSTRSSGAGGAGIVGSNLTVVDNGLIAGGSSGDGTSQANAITFTSGTNVLTLAGTINGGIGISGSLHVVTTQAQTAFVSAIHDATNGAGSLIYDSGGVLTLSGAGTYSGGTHIDSGTVVLAHATGNTIDAAGTGSIAVADGATLRLATSGTLASEVDFTSGTGTIAAATGATATLTGIVGENGATAIKFGTASARGTIVFGFYASFPVLPAASLIEVVGGTLRESGHLGQVLAPPPSFGQVTTRVDAGATLDLNGYSDVIDRLTGSGTVTNGAGGTASVKGGYFAGVFTGAGKVAIVGNTVLSGTSLNTGSTSVAADQTLTLASGGATSTKSAIVDNGTIKLAGGTLAGASLGEESGSSGLVTGSGTVSANVASAALDFTASGGALTFTGTDVFAGKLRGTEAVFAAGKDSLTSTATIAVSTFDIDGAAVSLGANLTYRGTFDLESGSLDVGAFNLNAYGALDLGVGTITGSGRVASYGTATLEGRVAIAGSVTLVVGENLTATGSLSLTGESDLLVNANGAYDLAGNGYIGARSDDDIVTNYGLIEKTAGTGRSLVTAAVANGGTIEVAKGTLDLTDKITGAGTLSISGNSAMELGAIISANQTVEFGKGNGQLRLDDAREFHATISGFGIGDSIALKGFDDHARILYEAATDGSKSGTLAVYDGDHRFATHIDGTYTAKGFSLTHTATGETIHYAAPKA